MNTHAPSRRHALRSLAALALLPLAARAAGGSLPPDSVYQLPAALVDQDGRPFELAALRGTPVLASMFYTSCDMVCPMIFETIRKTLGALPAVQRAAAKVLMVSFDPARDTVAVLKKTAEAHGCDAGWVLARGDEGTTRKLAAALGVQYRRLSNGEFNHSSTIHLLDREGRIAARSGKLEGADPAIVKAMHKAYVAKA